LPSVLVGLYYLAALPDGPSKARWLDGKERELIQQRLDADERARDSAGMCHRIGRMFLDLRV